MKAALYSIRNDPGIGLFYIHTTDYPMHTWATESRESREHLHRIESFIARILVADPEAMILLTADHTVKHKSLCWDQQKACESRNVPIRIALSPERDKYFKHLRGFGGTSYIYLRDTIDLVKYAQTIRGLKGIEEVLTRQEAVKRFHLMPNGSGI